ncbi:MAG: STAS domain-containing protein [Dehalococcoidia bacterium]|nr:STAS domain-containing protein [Dehalococcoidia bacterium]
MLASPLLAPLTTIPNIRANLLSGVVVGTIALPLSIALAVAVGVSPVSGLYTAVFAGAVAAIFGGSRYNVTGPTAALVPVLNHAVISHGADALPALALLSGAILLVLAALRAGRLVRYIPGTVVVGFTAGIALSIAFGQLNNLLGVTGTDPSLETFHERLFDTVAQLGTAGAVTPALAAATVLLLVAWPRLPRVRAVPGPLVAVVGMTAAVALLDLDVATVESRYGAIPQSLPRPSAAFLDAGLFIDLLPLAFSVAVLAGIESLLSAVVADGMSGSLERHEPDRELRGQGLGNLAVAFFGGVPATAAIARTAAGIRHGASSRLSAVVHSVTVLIATLLLGGVAGRVPMAALAGILVVVAWNIAEAPEVARLLRKASRADAVVLAGTAAITLLFDLTYAIGFGVLASMALLLRQLVRLPAARELLPDDTGRIREVSPELAGLIRSRPDIAFFSAEGVLSFHSVATMEYQLLHLFGADGRPLILRMKDVDHIDASGLLTLEGVIEHHQRCGGRIILTAIQPAVHLSLERFGILDLLGPGNVFQHTRCAIAAIDNDRILASSTAAAG